jgi:predicted nucleic acid-binding protein
MRATPDVRVEGWVREVPPAMVYTTSVTLAEVRFGIARLPAGRRRALLGDVADDVFGMFADRVLPFDAAAAGQYADVVVVREQAGAPIAGFDAQIAAICRSHRALLATRNTDDFSRLGLDLIDPWLTDT